MYQLLLYLHIASAIIAFGPTFSLPLIGMMAGREPAHANFALRAADTIARRRITPLAIAMAVTGVPLIWLGRWDLTRALWLDVAIVLYVINFIISLFVMTPAAARLIELTARPAHARPSGPPPGGPPSEGGRLVRRSQRGGAALAGSGLVILALMVCRPGL